MNLRSPIRRFPFILRPCLSPGYASPSLFFKHCPASLSPLAILPIVLSLLLIPSRTPAQARYEMTRNIETLQEGVRLWNLHYDRQTFKQRIVVLEIDTALPTVRLRAALGKDLWSGDTLRNVRERESALLAWQAIPQPMRGPALAWPGLTVVEHRLIAAPGQGPILAITPEGHVDLLESEPPDSGQIGSLDPLDLPIARLNRAPTTDTLTLLANPGLVRDSLIAGAPSPIVIAIDFDPIQPLLPVLSLASTTLPPLPWTACLDGRFRWNSQAAVPLADQQQFPPEWAGLVAIGARAERVRQTATARASGRIALQTYPSWVDYRTLIPLETWLVREGRVVVRPPAANTDPRRERRARSAIGLNRDQRHLYIVLVLDQVRNADGMTEYELAELLQAIGATDAAQGPDGNAMNADIQDRELLPPRRIAERCRLALLLDAGVPANPQWRNLAVPGTALVAGTAPLHFANRPASVIDGRQGYDPKLDNFWAAETTNDSTAFLLFDFQQQYLVGQVDLVHAQAVGFSPQADAREIRISTRRKDEGDWTPALTTVNDPPQPRQHVVLDPPVPARFLRLEFPQPNAIPGNHIVRMAEIIVWGTEEP